MRGNAPLTMQRSAHCLQRWGWHRTARLVTYLTSFVFSAVLAPEAEISRDAHFHHHALGVVIHPRVRVGRRVEIQHHVLLGTDVPLASPYRLEVGDDVRIGAYAILLGPITVGEHAVIGAGAVVTRDVPPGATVVGNPARVIASEQCDEQ